MGRKKKQKHWKKNENRKRKSDCKINKLNLKIMIKNKIN
jgi:hypothetical protein